MASVEVIALLCSGSTRYHEGGSSGAANDRLSKAELAGFLAGLSGPAMHLALAKYALDQDAERLLIAHVRLWAADIAVREEWQIVRGRPTVVNMAALAVFEAVRPNRCHRCDGRGYLGNKVCLICNGSGHKALTGRKIAEAIGVDECNYRRLWRARYDECFRYLQSLDSMVIRVIGLADKDNICHRRKNVV